ncbi:MAG TPA: mannitol dehydrogenase family protein [Acidimicrobiales bacterium]
MTVERLSEATRDRANAVHGPTYDRGATPTIAHLGVGAFARAHLAVYADDLLQAGHPTLIRGVSLRNPGAEEQLAPQDGLFSVDEREPGRDHWLRVVGSLASVGTGVESAIEAIAAPTTALITLTVTEKGYELDPIDRAEPDRPRSAPAVIARGLSLRRSQGPPVVASLDNVQDNGVLLRQRVIDAAEETDVGLARWIMEHVPFPSSVVDRMVPATTPSDLDDVALRLGLRDEATVVAEHHRSWFITEVDGLPPLADVGVRVVGDILPYQRLKLWLLNGPHSALAYGGLLAGCETIADAAALPVVSSFVRRLVDDILAVADRTPGVEPNAFAEESLRRFRNPELGHTCRQVGADGSRKLAQRLLPVVAARASRGLPTDRFAVVVAVWLANVTRLPVCGVVLPDVDDPDAAALRTAAEDRDRRALIHTALGRQATEAFADEVAGTLERLVRYGIDVLREDP